MFDHEDIQANLKYNHNDTIDGINNDNDSLQGEPLIDNDRGWDLADWDNDPSSPAGEDHGLRVAGVISATPDNNLGIAGAGFNTKYLPLKASPDNAPENLTSGYSGILYAAEHNCRVINVSWGSTVYPGPLYQEFIDYIVEEYDVVVVAAAGNSGKNEHYYPASFDQVISVTGIRADSTKQDLSTYNYNVDLCAVGWRTKTLRRFSTSSYGNEFGTSFAAPLVSATAALIAANQPTFTSHQIRKQLRVAALDIDTTAYNSPYQSQMGKLLDPTRALTDYTIPGLDIYSILIPDSLTIPSYGRAIETEITLTNLLADANNVTIKIESLNNTFSFTETEFTQVDLDQGEFLVLETKLIAPSNLAGTTGSFPAKISYVGENYHDYKIAIINYEYIACEPVDVVFSALQPSCITNDGEIICSELTDGSSYTLFYTQNEVSQSKILTPLNGVAVINQLGAGEYKDFVIDSASCKTDLLDAVTLEQPKFSPIFEVKHSIEVDNQGEILISKLGDNQEYQISYDFEGVTSNFPETSDTHGYLSIPNLAVGVYQNVTIDSAGCIFGVTKEMKIELVMGTELISEEFEFTIFPNPFHESVQINTSFSNYNLEVYSCSGELLLEKNVIYSGKNTIDLSSLPTGSYLITIRTDELVRTNKLVKL